MPRLLLLCEFPTLLGGERSMLSTLPRVQDAGFELIVACPAAGPLAAELARRRVCTIAWDLRTQKGRPPSLFERRAALGDIIAAARPDLIHANSLSMSRLSGPVAADTGIPSVGHLRDIIRLSASAIDDLNCHALVIAVSHATREHHIAQGLHPARCVVVHNGVDVEVFAPRPPTGYLHRELGIDVGVRLVVTVGQIGLRKGTDVALEAFRQVALRLPDVHWLLVGERTSDKQESRDFEHRVRLAARSPPLARRVHFLGTRHDVPKIFGECELLLHAAHQEPLGRVLLEAAAAGLPVVATDVGGTREIFPTAADGALLVPVGDAAALSAAVFAVLEDGQRHRALATAGRRRAEIAFDADRNAARLVQCYRETMSS